MSYLKEANRVIQRKYGYYCNSCKQKGETPMSYTQFKQKFISNGST